MCDPWHGSLSALVAGALVTHMILENGHRQPIYADGYGSAYTVANGNRVEVAQDVNGNWVQLSPDNQAVDAGPVQTAPVQVVAPAPVQQPPVIVQEKKGLGFWGWVGVFAALSVCGILIWSLINRMQGKGW